MDWLVLAFVALQAIALAIVLGIAWSRGRTLEGLDEALRDADATAPAGVASTSEGPDDDLTDRLRRLRRRAEAAEFGLEQRLRDLAYLADLVGVGIVRLNDDLRVEVANTAAHVFLRREPGSMLGRTAIEALGDHRVEAIARAAREAGWSSGEVTLADRPEAADAAEAAGAAGGLDAPGGPGTAGSPAASSGPAASSRLGATGRPGGTLIVRARRSPIL
ncbi:MAG: hypothetical protein L0221_04490, partial [Chloroflexi bacterium]|nr:hypothetical protein [Chloroflexota bacterium]